MAPTATLHVNLEECRRLLLARRSELISLLHGRTVALSHLSRVADDDQAPILHDEFVSSEMNRITYNQLKLVEAALAGIESGDYGQCRNCGTTISPKRLKAVPWAKYCIACEEHMSQASELAEFGQQVA